MRNWFKRLIGMDEQEINEVEETFTNETFNEYEKSSQNTRNQNIRNEFDTPKMTFEYPKGNFRFPVIPDESKGKNRQKNYEQKVEKKAVETSFTKREKRTVYEKREVSNPQYIQTKRFYEEKQVEMKKKEAQKEKPKVKEERKKPFSPTPFYSPIYGSRTTESKPYNRKEFMQKSVGLIKEEQKNSETIIKINDAKESKEKELHNISTESIELLKVSMNEKLNLQGEQKNENTINHVPLNEEYNNEKDFNEDSIAHISGVTLDEKEEILLTYNEVQDNNTDEELVIHKNAIDDIELEDVREELKDFIANSESKQQQSAAIAHDDPIDIIDEAFDAAKEAFADKVPTQEVINEAFVEHSEELNDSNDVEEIVVLLNDEISSNETEEYVVVEEKMNEPETVGFIIDEKEVVLEETAVTVNEIAPEASVTHERDLTENREVPSNNNVQQPVREESAPVSKRRRSSAPVNVMMLKSDRELMRRKTEQNHLPPMSLLSKVVPEDVKDTEWLEEQRELLNSTLHNFNVRANVVNYSKGPSVTRFEIHPEPGVKVNKITNLADDIKLALSARDIRIEAPIPGKNTIGIEVPNKTARPVKIKEIIGSSMFLNSESPLTVAIGLDISGRPIVSDISKMPHGLIAGATGSGKSVCINSFLISLLYKSSPSDMRLMLIDPKMVELAPYNDIPHLVSPVITDVKAATNALKWAVEEMERRYELFVSGGAREIKRYNSLVESGRIIGEKLPYLVIIIDELADLMLQAPQDVEEAICRIAQKARACGIHMLIATQRPSVDVITGLIKANIPTRMSFSVFSQIDSRTVLDTAGAEKLLGKGDMLILENGMMKPARVQGTYVSDDEIERVLEYVKRSGKPDYLFEQEDLLTKFEEMESEDELFQEVCEFIVEQGAASTSLLQRRFRIGYNRAARLIDTLESKNVISEAKGTKPREVLVTTEELEHLFTQNH